MRKRFKDQLEPAPLPETWLSFVPGVGTGISAALALANGKRIPEAVIAAAKEAIPGGPLVRQAMDIGMKAARR
jgi:hypothetical protein